MSCPSLENLPVIPPSPVPIAPQMLQAGDFDYTIDDPGFGQMLQDIVGNAGDDTDGTDLLLLELAAGIAEADAAITVADVILDAIGLLDDGFDAADLSPEIAAAATGHGNISVDIFNLESIIGEAPPPPGGGTSGGGEPSGPPAGYDDVLSFGDVAFGHTPTNIEMLYTWTNTTGAPVQLAGLAITSLGFAPGDNPPNINPKPVRPYSIEVRPIAQEQHVTPPPEPPGTCTDPGQCDLNWYAPDGGPATVGNNSSITWHIDFCCWTQKGLYSLGFGPQTTGGAVLWNVYASANVF